MATHSSVLAWRIPGTEEPGRLPSIGSHRVGARLKRLSSSSSSSKVRGRQKWADRKGAEDLLSTWCWCWKGRRGYHATFLTCGALVKDPHSPFLSPSQDCLVRCIVLCVVIRVFCAAELMKVILLYQSWVSIRKIRVQGIEVSGCVGLG